jgi:Zn-dependent metalloprotease
MKHSQNPHNEIGIYGIIPPHILEAIARNGTEAARAKAQRTLVHDSQVRLKRMKQAKVTHIKAKAKPVQAAGTAHKNRLIYTANNTTTQPGTLVRSEGQASSSDVAIDEAYDGLGATFDLYWDVFGRNSIDDNGLDMIGTVHYDNGYDNAFWDGTQMIFGDGDGLYYNRFTISIDVMGHELTHGVTEATAGLEYQDQSGALNESISDVFGSLVKQRFLNQTADQADWLIGAGLWTSNVNGVALRSMKAPGTAYDDPVIGKDPQPDNMSGYVNTTGDNGGVHINSGIPNKAFYLLATAIGGYAWEKAGNIWYKTLLDSRFTTTATFQDFANLTADNANTLYGADIKALVVQAWHDVGIEVTDGSFNNKLITGLWSIDQDRNAWVYVDGDGWKRIAYDNDVIFYNMLSELIAAKGSGSTVNLTISNDAITQVFVNA